MTDTNTDAVTSIQKWMDSEKHPVILDGGLGELVQKRGMDILPGSLWSGQMIKSNPEKLTAASQEWLDAGAEIICTATYQVTIEVLAKEFNLTKEEAARCVQGHCDQLQEAADDHWEKIINSRNAKPSEPTESSLDDINLPHRKPVVALSLGPLSAIHPDYDEFSSSYKDDITIESLQEFHRDRVTSFLGLNDENRKKSGKPIPASLIAFETIGVSSEAVAICQLMSDYNLPFWLSFQCRDEKSLASGGSLAKAIRAVLEICQSTKRLIALGINCVCVSKVDALSRFVRSEVETFMTTCGDPWKVNIIAYPNSGEVWHNRSWGWSNDGGVGVKGPLCEDDWAHVVHNAKANIIGGCCRTDPTHIAALRRVSLAVAAGAK